jgi:hypothetical protein
MAVSSCSVDLPAAASSSAAGVDVGVDVNTNAEVELLPVTAAGDSVRPLNTAAVDDRGRA